ncbi:hypothetical protein BUALT_Bualt10G0000500 [Buddleja alternifolia]|uniref:Uncharacterized protein n=1 Tax=Buddleja alternifolia TaxID=168488 RepID=A0AAV6X3H3_9LAMI|nr:hypothetical protein BUALT_Bualt10G0000500 [Buddleja alternifolia]
MNSSETRKRNLSFQFIAAHICPFSLLLRSVMLWNVKLPWSLIVDERAVLKQFDWPEPKADALREAAFGYCDPKKLECEIKLASMKLAMKYMRRVLAELEMVGGGPEEEDLIVQGVKFAF